MRIAVIGAGVSGLGSAYLLAPHASVTLYETENRLGGHANTAEVTMQGKTFPVDTGFMVFNPVHYPYFVSLLKELQIPSVDTVMSFSVSIPGSVEYSSNFSGLFGNPRQLLQPSYWRLLMDIIRFNRAAKAYLADTNSDRTMLLGDFLQKERMSRELKEWYRFPMMGSIWSAAAKDINAYPAYESFRFLNNHMLLNIFNKPVWQTVKGGSREYVHALEKRLIQEGVSIKTGTAVTRIERTHAGVVVHTASGSNTYDKIILATHADTALSLLADTSADEKRILGAFSYSNNSVVLHSDTSFMPKSKKAWASWNYHTPETMDTVISLTYHMNSLQDIPDTYPVFVTLNPRKPVDPSKVHGTYTYAHPVFNEQARSAQAEVSKIQNVQNTCFAGAHLGFGFHEDGMLSAVKAVQALGFPIRLVPNLHAEQNQKHELLTAVVGHKRLTPKEHVFSYPVFYTVTPVSDTIPHPPRLFSIDRFNIFSIFTKDHGARNATPWRQWLHDLCRTEGIPLSPADSVYLVSHPRLFGYAFNPISFWLIYEKDRYLKAVVCEVRNTFGDNHCYVLAHPDLHPIQKTDVFTAGKNLYVSPFNTMEGSYTFSFDVTPERFGATINYFEHGTHVLNAHMSGTRSPLTAKKILLSVLRYPLMTVMVVVRIHYQALKLWWKGVPNTLSMRPEPTSGKVTKGGSLVSTVFKKDKVADIDLS